MIYAFGLTNSLISKKTIEPALRELKARKGAKLKVKNRELWNRGIISHEDTNGRPEPESANVLSSCPSSPSW